MRDNTFVTVLSPTDAKDAAVKLGVAITKLVNGRGSCLVRLQHSESISSFGLQSNFTDKGDVLEQRDDVVLSRDWMQVADIDRGVVTWRGREDLLIAQRQGTVVVSSRSRVRLLVRPIDTQRSSAEPLSVQRAGETSQDRCQQRGKSPVTVHSK